MGSKTGGNNEPMPFVRKWGAAAAAASEDGDSVPPPSFADRMPSPDLNSSRRRSRSRSRSRDRKRDRGERRRRSRSRSRSREKRRRTRSPRDRRRSRSKERSRRRTPTPEPILPKEPVVNPLMRVDIAPVGGDDSANFGMQVAVVEKPRERKSRWSTTKSFVPGMPTILPSNLTDEQRSAYLLQLEIEDSTRKLRLGDFLGSSDPRERSPSPEPVYDSNGKRLNTREVRKRQELEQLRHEKIQGLLKLNPNFKPPTDYRAPNVRLHDKVFIPQDNHPELNFVGLLIGPRGNTLKSLEAETGAKIIIRGKGSIKEGKLGSRMGPMPGENEPLHAYVTATDQATIKRACDKIRSIIAEATAIPDGQNELRKLQLRELALLNGTLRPEDLVSGARCSNCGSDEHKTWECPEAANITAKIVCTNCGAAGHISRDCKNPRAVGAGFGGAGGMDDEYSALMEELGERPRATQASAGGDAFRGRGGFGGSFVPRGGPSFARGGFRGGFSSGFDGRAPDIRINLSTEYSGGPMGARPPMPQPYGGYPPVDPYQAPGFYPSPGAQRGRGGYGASRGGWYGGGSMPLPVPPPPPPMGGFPPPPPPPPPVPQPDLSRLLAAAPPPPPPQ